MTEPTPAPTTTPAGSNSRRDTWLWAGLLLLLTLIVYQPAIHGSFLWDDNRYAMIGVNTPLRSAHGLADIWLKPSTGTAVDTFTTVQYYPFTFTAFWVQYHLWGVNTVGYHVVNVLLHAGSALVLWQLLKLLRVPGAWVAAAIFAVHPIEVESVAWITELKNVLSGFFILSSLYAYLRFAAPEETGGAAGAQAIPGLPRLSGWAWYTLSVVCFVFAVFSKTVVSLMPVVAFILLYWRFRPRLSVRTIVGLVPFLLLGLVLSRQTAWMEKHVVGAIGADWALSFADRVVIAGRAFWFYPGKLLWPANLAFTYPRWAPGGSEGSHWVYPVSAGVVVAASVVWLLIGKRYRGVPAAVLIYAVLLFPAMGFFNVYPMRFSFVADHFQYLAGIAVISLVVGVVASGLWRGDRAPGAAVVQGFAAVVILACVVLTWRQSSIYASPFTLWQDTVAKNPDTWMGHYNLGTELARRGLEARAAGDSEAAGKDFAEAITHFERTVAIRPQHAGAYANWAAVLVETGHPEEAIAKAKESIAIDPSADEPHLTAAQAYGHMNKPAEARAEYEKAVAAAPDSWRARLQLGRFLAAEGKLPEAEVSLRKAEALRPNDASIEIALATTLDRQLKVREALIHAGRAAELRPNDAEILTTLGFIWGENGRPREAYAAFNRALELDPNNARAIEGAKMLIDAVGKMKRAATTRSATQPATTRGASTRPVATASTLPANGPGR